MLSEGLDSIRVLTGEEKNLIQNLKCGFKNNMESSPGVCDIFSHEGVRHQIHLLGWIASQTILKAFVFVIFIPQGLWLSPQV